MEQLRTEYSHTKVWALLLSLNDRSKTQKLTTAQYRHSQGTQTPPNRTESTPQKHASTPLMGDTDDAMAYSAMVK